MSLTSERYLLKTLYLLSFGAAFSTFRPFAFGYAYFLSTYIFIMFDRKGQSIDVEWKIRQVRPAAENMLFAIDRSPPHHA